MKVNLDQMMESTEVEKKGATYLTEARYLLPEVPRALLYMFFIFIFFRKADFKQILCHGQGIQRMY